MNQIAIHAVDLSKEYWIGRSQNNFRTLRDTLTSTFASPFRRAKGLLSGHTSAAAELDQKFTALDCVSFDVQVGEVVGIIGRNGAGKSTLLKILARVVDPSAGYIEMKGRVSSILEVGTGFHPELTGRENVFLNGAILGMRRAEIIARFDEIVAFSGVERFIDTPVKHYSSGMYVRLAFSVAANLATDVLLVDEVLAVGDVGFQDKCIRKMEEVATAGRTVVFVSHNIQAVSNLCSRVLLLDEGRIAAMGGAQEVAERYLQLLKSSGQRSLSDIQHCSRGGNGGIRFTDMRLRDEHGRETKHARTLQSITFELPYSSASPQRLTGVDVAIGFYSVTGQFLFSCETEQTGKAYQNLPPEGILRCRIPTFPLKPGEYRLNIRCKIHGALADHVRDAFILQVVPGDCDGLGQPVHGQGSAVVIGHEWLLTDEHAPVLLLGRNSS